MSVWTGVAGMGNAPTTRGFGAALGLCADEDDEDDDDDDDDDEDDDGLFFVGVLNLEFSLGMMGVLDDDAAADEEELNGLLVFVEGLIGV